MKRLRVNNQGKGPDEFYEMPAEVLQALRKLVVRYRYLRNVPRNELDNLLEQGHKVTPPYDMELPGVLYE